MPALRYAGPELPLRLEIEVVMLTTVIDSGIKFKRRVQVDKRGFHKRRMGLYKTAPGLCKTESDFVGGQTSKV